MKLTIPHSPIGHLFMEELPPPKKKSVIPVPEPIEDAMWSEFIEITIPEANGPKVTYLPAKYSGTIVIGLKYE